MEEKKKRKKMKEKMADFAAWCAGLFKLALVGLAVT